MQIQNILLIVISSIIILSILAVGRFFPNLLIPNVSYIIVSVIFIGNIVIYWFINRQSTDCSSGDPGTCISANDCTNNGKCVKDGEGNCACVCDPDYTGQNCEKIKWDSSHCMGPNSKWPSRKGENNECLCPNDNWTDGTDPTFGYVKCLGCAGNWGPLDGESPCSGIWNTSDYLSTDCYNADKKSVACDEYNNLIKYASPSGQNGSISALNFCDSTSQLNSCRCPKGSINSRAICEVTGYLDPNKLKETCENSINERQCSSYNCKN